MLGRGPRRRGGREGGTKKAAPKLIEDHHLKSFKFIFFPLAVLALPSAAASTASMQAEQRPAHTYK